MKFPRRFWHRILPRAAGRPLRRPRPAGNGPAVYPTRHTALPAAAVALCAALLAGCQTAGEPEAPAAPADAAPPAIGKPPPGAVRYRIVPGASAVVIRVYRAGSLARLGHNHVIATSALTGTVDLTSPLSASRLEIGFDKTALQVDDPTLRARSGEAFAEALPPDAIEGTRENMLGPRLLDAERYPRVSVRAVGIDGTLPATPQAPAEALTVHAMITVLEEPFPVSFPVQVRREGERLVATGSRTLTHGALGLEPFSVMLGALSVRDEMEITYSIIIERNN